MPPAGYSGTPLVKKLGIKPGSTLALVGAPAGFRDALVGLADDVHVVMRSARGADMTIWFAMSIGDLDARIEAVGAAMGAALWIAWPKKASGVATDLHEHAVRAAGLAYGLVDYKVCAIDGVWSGLKFARRRV